MAGWEENFRLNMKTRREMLGHTQTDMARMMKLRGYAFHQQTIQRIETGDRPVRLDEAYELADLLDTSLDELSSLSGGEFGDTIATIDKLMFESREMARILRAAFAGWLPLFRELEALAHQFVDSGSVPNELEAIITAWYLKAATVVEEGQTLLGSLGQIHGAPGADPELIPNYYAVEDWYGTARATSRRYSSFRDDSPEFLMQGDPVALAKKLRAAIADREERKGTLVRVDYTEDGQMALTPINATDDAEQSDGEHPAAP